MYAKFKTAKHKQQHQKLVKPKNKQILTFDSDQSKSEPCPCTESMAKANNITTKLITVIILALLYPVVMLSEMSLLKPCTAVT